MKNISRKTALAGALVLALACGGLAGCSSESSDSSGTSSEATGEGGSGSIVCESDYVGAESDDINAWLADTVYDVDAQAAIAEDLDSQKDGQTLSDPLIVYNPFGTNSQSLYVYFNTDEAASISYTVSVSDEEAATIEDESFTADSIADFTRDVNDGESATEHEFMLIGLIPTVENTVTITASYEDGTTESYELACDMCDVLGGEELQLDIEEGTSDEELADGLYAVMGAELEEGINAAYLYDNDGILRGEVPVIRRVQRFIEENDLLYYSDTDTSVVAMNEIGQIVSRYVLNEDGDYTLHHDYIVNDENHLLVLGTDKESDTMEDLVLSYDLETGELDAVVDLGDLLGSYKEEALAYHEANADTSLDDEENADGETGVDWLHINAIQWMGDDTVLLSSRETSTIMKISDIYGTPTLEYFISSEEYWEDTEYADYVLEQVGDFTVNGGQHSIEIFEDDSLEDGQYYLGMFDNNVGVSNATTSDFDYSSVGLTNTMASTADDGAVSYYYKYLVDENEGTFELVYSIELPFSGYGSGAWSYGDHVVSNSATQLGFNEYDADGELICNFTMDSASIIYRVFKYDW